MKEWRTCLLLLLWGINGSVSFAASPIAGSVKDGAGKFLKRAMGRLSASRLRRIPRELRVV
jgi:hypothetical protein